jgi:hypothetical protein
LSKSISKTGCSFRQEFRLEIQPEALFNAGIFLDDIRTIFLQYIDVLPGRAVLAQEIAILLMDDCSGDLSDDVIRILTEASVRFITFAPHTTQVLQVLDLTLFGVLKRCPRYELPFDDNNATAKGITKVYHHFAHTMVRSNTLEAFRALYFEFDMRREPPKLLFDEIKSRESADFEGLGSVTFPWISCGADDVLLTSVGSTSLNKLI